MDGGERRRRYRWIDRASASSGTQRQALNVLPLTTPCSTPSSRSSSPQDRSLPRSPSSPTFGTSANSASFQANNISSHNSCRGGHSRSIHRPHLWIMCSVAAVSSICLLALSYKFLPGHQIPRMQSTSPFSTFAFSSQWMSNPVQKDEKLNPDAVANNSWQGKGDDDDVDEISSNDVDDRHSNRQDDPLDDQDDNGDQSKESPEIKDLYGYSSLQELRGRSTRFPTLEQRVQLYMGHWYAPPCPGAEIAYEYQPPTPPKLNDPDVLVLREVPPPILPPAPEAHQARTFQIHGKIKMAQLIYYNEPALSSCNTVGKQYCDDVKVSLVPTFLKEQQRRESQQIWDRPHVVDEKQPTQKAPPATPLLMQFGDREISQAYVPALDDFQDYPRAPYFKKFRPSFDPITRQELAVATCTRQETAEPLQPIIWKLKELRHFGMLSEIPPADRPWDQKIPGAVFRGKRTGIHKEGLTNRAAERMTPEQRCQHIPRCRLVSRFHKDSPDLHIDVAMVGDRYGLPNKYFGESMTYEEMLQYKAIIVVEGNDVATGLKWALYSNSVVMTPPPVLTAWAMEELLEPWVHYIPLNDDLGDVDEKVQWMIDHDDEAQQIAYRGQLWMRDLVFHPDASKDEDKIFKEIMRRYHAHFAHQPGLATASLR